MRVGDANFVPTNAADDWIHIAFVVTMIGSALLLGRRAPQRAAVSL